MHLTGADREPAGLDLPGARNRGSTLGILATLIAAAAAWAPSEVWPLAGAGLAVGVLGLALAVSRDRAPRPAVIAALLAVACCGAVSAVSSIDPTRAAAYLTLFLGAAVLAWVAAATGPAGPRVVVLGLLLAALGPWALWQSWSGLDVLDVNLAELSGPAAEYVRQRLEDRRGFASLPLPGHLAALLAMALPLLTARGPALWAPRLGGVIACLAGLAATRSPVGLVLAALAVVLSRPNRVRTVGPVAALVLVAALAGVALSRPDLGEVEPLRLRLDNWRAAGWLWRTAPLAGTGLGSFGQQVQSVPLELGNRPAHAHGLPAEWAAEIGVPGALASLLLLAAVLRLAFRVWGARPDIAAALVVVPLHNLVDFSFFVSGVVLPWAVILGWAIGLDAGEKPHSAAEQARARTAWTRRIWQGAAGFALGTVSVGLVVLHGASRQIEDMSRGEPAARRFELANRAARLAPWRPEPAYQLALAAVELGTPEAIATARYRLGRARPLRPRSVAQLRLSAALALATGDVESAVAASWLAAQERPEKPELHDEYQKLVDLIGQSRGFNAGS